MARLRRLLLLATDFVLAPVEIEGPELASALTRELKHGGYVVHCIEPRGVLCGQDLSGQDLQRANLREANLSFVNLRGSDLSGADLREPALNHADLRDADLRGADLRGADLTFAKLMGAQQVRAQCNRRGWSMRRFGGAMRRRKALRRNTSLVLARFVRLPSTATGT